jgi:hypothetical protein
MGASVHRRSSQVLSMLRVQADVLGTEVAASPRRHAQTLAGRRANAGILVAHSPGTFAIDATSYLYKTRAVCAVELGRKGGPPYAVQF